MSSGSSNKKLLYSTAPEFSTVNENIYDGRYILMEDGTYQKPWIRRIGGWDVGRTNDRSVLAILDYCHDGRYRLIGLYKWRNVPFPKQLSDLNKLCQFCEVEKLTMDGKNMGKALPDFIKELDEHGNYRYPYIAHILDPVFNVSRDLKDSTYIRMRADMESDRFYIMRETDLTNEFTKLVRKENGRIEAEGRKDHDDIPSAVMFACAGHYESRNDQFDIFFI